VKKAASLVLAFSIACSAFAGSAAAATHLETTVDKLIGVDYLYGGTTTNGFDCSGFTGYVFDKLGIDLPRRSVDQATVGTKVAKADLIPGDLVFFNTNGIGISHMGIYMGDGTFAHSSSSRGVTIGKLNDSYYSKRYVTARRVLSEEQFTKFATEAEVIAAAAPVDQAVEASIDVIIMTEAAELSAEHEDQAIDTEAVIAALQEILR
jgi:hypothetical protein